MTRRHGQLLGDPQGKLFGERLFDSRIQARAALFDHIEVFYNRPRLHSALNYKTPVEYENSVG